MIKLQKTVKKKTTKTCLANSSLSSSSGGMVENKVRDSSDVIIPMLTLDVPLLPSLQSKMVI